MINYQRLRFLVIAQGNVIQMFAWAPKPYHKFMPYKVFTDLPYRPLIVDMTVEEDSRMKVKFISLIRALDLLKINDIFRFFMDPKKVSMQ